LDARLRSPSDRRVGRCGFRRSTMRVGARVPASGTPHSPTSRVSSWVSPGKLDMPLPRLHFGESRVGQPSPSSANPAYLMARMAVPGPSWHARCRRSLSSISRWRMVKKLRRRSASHGIVTSSGRLRFLCPPGSQRDEENQLRRLPIPARDHSAGLTQLRQAEII
jgi:hypothetical protein